MKPSTGFHVFRAAQHLSLGTSVDDKLLSTVRSAQGCESLCLVEVGKCQQRRASVGEAGIEGMRQQIWIGAAIWLAIGAAPHQI